MRPRLVSVDPRWLVRAQPWLGAILAIGCGRGTLHVPVDGSSAAGDVPPEADRRDAVLGASDTGVAFPADSPGAGGAAGGAVGAGGGGAGGAPLASGSFRPVGPMVAARSSHTATLLANGKVLIAGGYDEHGLRGDTAELYDPSTRKFVATASMSTPRFGHTATLLPNGRVLITGGNTRGSIEGGDQPMSSAELYEPSTGAFVTAGTMSEARGAHTATLLPNGKVLIAGSSADLYDPASGIFTAVGFLPIVSSGYTATLLESGRVLVIQSDNRAGGANVFDPPAGGFSQTGSLTTARLSHTASSLGGGRVLIAGGGYLDSTSVFRYPAYAEIYDQAAGTFSQTGGMITPRSYHAAARLLDGRVLVAGGARDKGIGGSAELYDPVTGRFAATGTMAVPRTFHTATLLSDGEVLIAGGDSSVSAEIYHP